MIAAYLAGYGAAAGQCQACAGGTVAGQLVQPPPGPVTADGSALPDPIPDGSTVTLQWDANFQPVETSLTASGDTQRDAVLADLVQQAIQTASVFNAVAQGTDIVMEPAPGFVLGNAQFVVT